MAFKGDIVPENWKTYLLVLLYKGKGYREECKNYRSINFVSGVG